MKLTTKAQFVRAALNGLFVPIVAHTTSGTSTVGEDLNYEDLNRFLAKLDNYADMVWQPWVALSPSGYEDLFCLSRHARPVEDIVLSEGRLHGAWDIQFTGLPPGRYDKLILFIKRTAGLTNPDPASTILHIIAETTTLTGLPLVIRGDTQTVRLNWSESNDIWGGF